LFVCFWLSISLENHTAELHQIFNMLPRSVLVWRRHDRSCASGFTDDVMLTHTGPYGASCVFVSKLSIRSVAAKTTASNPTNFLNDKDQQVTHRGLGTGGKVCYLRLPCFVTKVTIFWQPFECLYLLHCYSICMGKNESEMTYFVFSMGLLNI